MKELMYFVDNDREYSIVHRFDLECGNYLPPRRIDGTLDEQSENIMHIIRDDLYHGNGVCTKIIFSKALGTGLRDIFHRNMCYEEGFVLDNYGNIKITNLTWMKSDE